MNLRHETRPLAVFAYLRTRTYGRSAQKIIREANKAEQAVSGILGFGFSPGLVPGRTEFVELVSGQKSLSISHDHAGSQEQGAWSEAEASGGAWLELLVDGLTFTIAGFASEPAAEHEFGGRARRLKSTTPTINGLLLSPGPHLAEGANSLPVVRTMMALGATLAGLLPRADYVTWKPSTVCIDPGVFEADIDRWLKGGTLPVPAMVSFKPTLDEALASHGLAFFHGQELRIEPELANVPDSAMRLAIRLADHLLHRGRIEAVEVLTAPDGSALRLDPWRNGKIVRVWPR